MQYCSAHQGVYPLVKAMHMYNTMQYLDISSRRAKVKVSRNTGIWEEGGGKARGSSHPPVPPLMHPS